MSITYEEALTTLTSMFGSPWTKASLDAVLRHHNGHMENTVESVLLHGEGHPDDLVRKLKTGGSNQSLQQAQSQMDEELARQLAKQQHDQHSSATDNSNTKKKGRGTPTGLPPDFLRVPGSYTAKDDEALARMLQDELFTQELANNPEFAHLALSPRTAGGRAVRSQSTSAQKGGIPATKVAPRRKEEPNIIEKISELGENAKKRLAVLAAQWNATKSKVVGGHNIEKGVISERRGLLENAEDEVDFEPDEMEMGVIGVKKEQ
mmetsp:Transcript_20036/g.30449  ORF Transcript_20036/g.30449 Transcript_20036/m.30449 type:complete len:263 (-) Transcript_20036:1795-2583(-)|eukprot:CAMPEP_0118687466 /NCGR_PEP_ID=MMETSP0800-20121206/8396_1 /TAXON_ID=210618 ORGANISM="Striatella unipunctata, Strain CCMP2910" /NCGR_SAMPLE_ID=MMETSP0800 /ASSEMBLY_ACC=CAM_ASM_000638 /LENGTH=262 /DNA_ID=CAMNT_0006584649 /DNA_START=59 /DNA_END=847 /DNA_ORIENTATION=-